MERQFMHRHTQFAPLALAALILGGCGAPRPIKYYTVQIPATPAQSNHTHTVDLLVGRVSGPDILQASPIAYRTGSNEIGTYQYHRWIDSPVDMVQEKLICLLQKSGDYQSVSGAAGVSGSGLVIRGRLYDFAEVDGDKINGLVTMEFELYDRKAAKVLWSHYYSQTEPAQGKTVPLVVQALDRNLDRGLKEVAGELGKYFADHPPSRTEAQQQ
jgi:ABC-type uncharacterized transport system auxiliary subunit